MDWNQAVDAYCERIGPEFWSEPVNALSNVAFLLAALWVWPRARGRPIDRALAAILAGIGIGSFLFHTVARAWAGLADVLPIGLFVVVYLYAACRDFIGLQGWKVLGTTGFFLGMLAVGVHQMDVAMPALGANAAYIGTCALIFGFGVGLLGTAPATGRGLLIGASLLALSIAARMLDMAICPGFPLGTHFLWHLLNAVLLGWMIEVHLRRGARLAGGGAAR